MVRKLTPKEKPVAGLPPEVAVHPKELKVPVQRRESFLVSKPRRVEGYTTLSQLAVSAGMQAQLARLHVKKAGIKKPAAGWRWKTGSRELSRVCKVLEVTSPGTF